MKKTFYTEAAYLAGLLVLAVGTALMEKADFGLSMVVAPAYLLHLKISQALPFFSFGMAEYTLQAAVLAGMMLLLRRFRLCYLLSFGTAVLYGVMLDGALALFAPLPAAGMAIRTLWYVLGLLLCSAGVSLLFHTYIAPEAYELFVKEVSAKWELDIHRVKTVYDCVSCAVGVAMSFAFFGFGRFEGVKLGTILCALVNGYTISRFTHLFEARLEFTDRFALRKVLRRDPQEWLAAPENTKSAS